VVGGGELEDGIGAVAVGVEGEVFACTGWIFIEILACAGRVLNFGEVLGFGDG